MLQSFYVKIVSAALPTYWYAKLIGHEFEVYEWGSDYVLKEDYDRGDRYPWCHITKSDCVARDAQLRNEADDAGADESPKELSTED